MANPNLPVWHPDHPNNRPPYTPQGVATDGQTFTSDNGPVYTPQGTISSPGSVIPGSGGGTAGTYQDQARPAMDPTTQYGNPSGAPTIDSPLLPSIDDLESNANFAFLQDLLNSYGIGDAYETLIGLIADDASPEEIELEIRNTDVFRNRFPQIFEREANGQTPISPADVINYERQLEEMMSFYNVPDEVGGSIQELVAELMTDDVSLNEVTQRLMAQRVFADEVLNDPDMDQGAVQAILGEGVTPYDIANYALDPEKALSDITQRFEAAAISSEAAQTGFGLDPAEALELQRRGLTRAQAEQGFGAIAQSSQVLNGIGNEADPVSRAEELAALTGDVAASAAIERATRLRTSKFEVGGGFARDDDGFGGLR